MTLKCNKQSLEKDKQKSNCDTEMQQSVEKVVINAKAIVVVIAPG